MSTVVIKTIPFRGANYRAQREDGKVVVCAESTTKGQNSVRGIYNLSAKIWLYDDCMPKLVKNNIEESFA